MGVFGKISGLFGGNKAAKRSGSPAARPIPAGSPIGNDARARVSPPEFDQPRSPTASSPTTGSPTAGSEAKWAPQSSASRTATLEPENTSGRVVIDLSDDSDSTNASTPSRFSGQDSADMLSDAPPPPPPLNPPPFTTPSTQTKATFADEMLEPVRTPRNRQELIEELQKNYAEVVSLVRKMDGHLDNQDKRSEQMLNIAESIPAAIEDLSKIRSQHAQLAEAIEGLTEATRQGSNANEAAQSLQIKALGEVRTLLETSEGHELQVAETLEDFKESIGQIAVSTGQLSGVLEGMDSRQQRREDNLREAIESGQKWMATAVVLGLVCLGIVVIVGVLAFA